MPAPSPLLHASPFALALGLSPYWMSKLQILAADWAGTLLTLYELWRGSSFSSRATSTIVLFFLLWQILRLLFAQRLQAASGAPWSEKPWLTRRVSELITDADLRDLMNALERFNGNERWEDVIDKSSDLVSYKGKLCRPDDGPLKYFSVATFEKCTTELLRDFYTDNEYRKKWDKILVHHENLHVDVNSGTEIGRSIRKFPLLKPREYILAWRLWEGKDKTLYCFAKDCEYPLAPRRNKYVRVGFVRSGWRIRKVPGREACEITMVHQEDAGINIEMAKVAFINLIWSHVCKMNIALRNYSCSRVHSSSVPTLHKLIKTVPPELEINAEARSETGRHGGGNASKKKASKWMRNGFLLVGGIVCLSRGWSAAGSQLFMACVLKKLMKHGVPSNASGIET